MKDVIEQVNDYLQAEFEVNMSNYSESDEVWADIYKSFQDRYLLNEMNDHWHKIPIAGFSEEKRIRLMNDVIKRKIFLIKVFTDPNGKKYINAFCSPPLATNDLRHCLVFNKRNNHFKLFSIETICENCFGIGFISGESGPCLICSGTGFLYSLSRVFINWKTIFHYQMKPEFVKIFDFPDSEEQKKAISFQLD